MKTKLPSARRLPSGKYRCQVMVNGQRISVVEDEPDIAQAKAVAMKNGLIEKAKKPNKLTLQDAIKEYISIRENVLAPTTVRGYETLRKHRFKGLMSKDIYKLTKRDLQKAVDAESKNYARKTVANALGLVCSVLRDYDIEISADDIKLPQKIKQKKTYLSAADIAKLIDAARGDICELPIVMAVWLGMRVSEICGLCWDCVDLEHNIIEVRRAFVPDKDNQYAIKEVPKNESSQRTIALPSYIAVKLRDMYHGQDGRVCPQHPNTVLRHVHKLCAKHGITDSTTHGLRHSNAAVMVALNVADRYAMARNGWSTEYTFKQVYSYVFPETSDAENQKINAFFEGLIK